MSQSMKSFTVLVTGATGNQGLATINALTASPHPPSTIFALTRNASSPRAKTIEAKSSTIKLLAGDLDDCPAIFSSAPIHVDAVFSVQINFYGGPNEHIKEEVQARNLIEAALSHGVKQFVQSTGDRGGPGNSAIDPTNVPNFATKFHIEQHLMSRAAATGMTWTILRPTSFMENLTDDLQGKGFARMWSYCGDKPLQLVATKDIGIFAAKALLESGDPRWRNKAVGVCGDELTQAKGSEVYAKVMGRGMPIAPCVVGKLVQWKVPELKSMFTWFSEVGCAVDVAECRAINPGMLDLEGWLRKTKV